MVDVINPWKTLSTQEVYDNPWINVREDQVIQPDGRPGIYGVVHFKNKAIGIIPVDEDDRIILVGQYRYPLGAYSWEIPEGGCPEHEDSLTAAKRELLEETGLVAQQWSLLGTAHLSNSVSDEIAHYFVARNLTETEACPEPTEVLVQKKVSFDEALAMVLAGEITDALSVMALLHFDVARKQERQLTGAQR